MRIENTEQNEPIQIDQEKDTGISLESRKNRKRKAWKRKWKSYFLGGFTDSRQPNTVKPSHEESNNQEVPREDHRAGPHELNIFNLNLGSTQDHQQKQTILCNKDEDQLPESSCLYRGLDKIDTFLNLAYFFNLLKAMQLEALVGAMTSIISIDHRSLTGMLNLVFSVVVVAFYFLLIVLVVYLTCLRFSWGKNEKKREKEAGNGVTMAKNLQLLEELKEQSKEIKRLRLILVLSLIQDFVIPLSLTLFIDNPGAQITTAMALMGVSLYSVLRQTPFQKVQKNLLEAGNRAIYLLILLVFLANLIFDKKIGEKARFNYIGFGVIGLISLLIGFNIGISVWVIVEKIKKKFTNKKGQKKELKKLHPLENDENWVSVQKYKPGRRESAIKKKNSGFGFLDDEIEKESTHLQNQSADHQSKLKMFIRDHKGGSRMKKQVPGRLSGFGQLENRQKRKIQKKRGKKKKSKRIIPFVKKKKRLRIKKQNKVVINSSRRLKKKAHQKEIEGEELEKDLEEFILD